METIRFDDIEKLKSKVSQEFSAWSQAVEVTQDKINQFADVTGDYQPFISISSDPNARAPLADRSRTAFSRSA